MFKQNFYIYLSIFVFITMGLLPANAEDMPLRGPIPFNVMDTDSNNMLSPDEFIKAHNQRLKMRRQSGMRMREMMPPGFTYFDRNHDNQISQNELKAGRVNWQQQRRNMGMGMGRNQGMGRSQGMGRNMPNFSDFDLNADGVLRKEEFYDARAKRMYKRAEQGYPMRNAAKAPPFEDIDTNNDGKISPDEFSAHQAEHKKMRMQNQ